MARRTPVKIITAPVVGAGVYLRYDVEERENDGQGAVIGHEEVLRYSPTRKLARATARKLLADGVTQGVTLLQPLEYIRPRRTTDR